MNETWIIYFTEDCGPDQVIQLSDLQGWERAALQAASARVDIAFIRDKMINFQYVYKVEIRNGNVYGQSSA